MFISWSFESKFSSQSHHKKVSNDHLCAIVFGNITGKTQLSYLASVSELGTFVRNYRYYRLTRFMVQVGTANNSRKAANFVLVAEEKWLMAVFTLCRVLGNK